GLSVTALDGERAVFLPIDDPLDDTSAATDDPEEAHLRLLYRGQRRYAAGRNVAVHASARDGDRCAHRLETRWLPTYDVPATVAPLDDSRLASVQLAMDTLAKADIDELRVGLAPLVDGYI